VGESLSELGIKERRVGQVTILETDTLMRINLKFGRSSVTLASAVEALLAGGQKNILLNLDGVNSMSARTLGDLVSMHLAAKEGGGQFKLFNPTPMVRQLMRVTNLAVVFNLYDNEKEAIESFDVIEGSVQ
jgi:anti-sigma B factor antagonist